MKKFTEIEAVDHGYKGYSPQEGWSVDAIPKAISRLDLPDHEMAILT
jgi:hypothetical protein